MEFVAMIWLETGGQRRSDLAEKLCRQLTRLSPGDARVWFNLGRACADQGKFAPAIEAFTQHLILRPNSVDALVSRAWCYKLSGRHRECRVDAEHVRAINPYDRDLDRLLQDLDETSYSTDAPGEVRAESAEEDIIRQRSREEAHDRILQLMRQAREGWHVSRNSWMSNPERAITNSQRAVLLAIEALHTAQRTTGVPLDPESVIFRNQSGAESSSEAYSAHRQVTELLEDIEQQIQDLGFPLDR
jgi:tetratricopeptide (TPR) repeat protein